MSSNGFTFGSNAKPDAFDFHSGNDALNPFEAARIEEQAQNLINAMPIGEKTPSEIDMADYVLRDEYEEMDRRLAALEDHFEIASEEKKAAVKKLKDCEMALAVTRNDLELAQIGWDKSKDDIKELQKRLKTQDKASQGSRDQVTDLKKDCSKLKQLRLDLASAKAASKPKPKPKPCTTCTSYPSTISRLEAEYGILEQKYTNSEAKCSDLSSENCKTLARFGKLDEAYANLAVENGNLLTSIAITKSAIGKLVAFFLLAFFLMMAICGFNVGIAYLGGGTSDPFGYGGFLAETVVTRLHASFFASIMDMTGGMTIYL